jgi:uncharacterized protein (TIGR02266 family)
MLPGAKYRAGSPTYTVSGLHPRVVHNEPANQPDDFEAVDPAAVLEQKLADTQIELEAARRERDALEARLAAALAELSALKVQAPAIPEPVDEYVEVDGDDPVATPASEPSEVMVAQPVKQEPGATGELSRIVVTPAAESSRPSSAERRRGDRRECEFEVEFLSDTHFMTGITQDLSEGGIFIATYQRLPIGTEVGLAFDLPGDRRVETKGEVRWVRNEHGETRPGLGIAFTDLGGDALASITAYCAGGSSRYYEF